MGLESRCQSNCPVSTEGRLRLPTICGARRPRRHCGHRHYFHHYCGRRHLRYYAGPSNCHRRPLLHHAGPSSCHRPLPAVPSSYPRHHGERSSCEAGSALTSHANCRLHIPASKKAARARWVCSVRAGADWKSRRRSGPSPTGSVVRNSSGCAERAARRSDTHPIPRRARAPRHVARCSPDCVAQAGN